MSTHRLPSTPTVASVTSGRRYGLVLAALALAALAPVSSAEAQSPAGTLDVTFDGDGIATTRIGITTDDGRAVAIQDDGRIVVAGASTHGGLGTLFTVVRFRPDGSLDATFGGDGVVTTAFSGNTRNEARAIAIDPAGRIVVAGETFPAAGSTLTHTAVARYLPDGSLDVTFGGDGTVDTPLDTRDSAGAVAVQPDGRIVVAGSSSPFTTGGWMMLARYRDDGSLDPTFGHADPVREPCDDDADLQPGVVRTSIGSTSVAQAIELNPDGQIVVAGRAQAGSTVDVVVARYHSDGHLDPSFGGLGTSCPGITLTDLTDEIGTSNDAAAAMDLMADGRFVVAGTAQHSSRGVRAVLVRYTIGGRPDHSFGDSGIVLAPAGIAQGNAIAVDGDNRPVVTGDSHNGGHFDFRLLRYTVDGTLDPTFGPGGVVTTQVSAGDDRVRGMALQHDGRIVVVGFATNDLAAVRYLGDPTPTTDTPPVADAGGPYDADEGATVTLAAAASSDPSGDALAYAWDLDGDGSYETEGPTAPFSAVGRDGPGSTSVELRVCDGSGVCDTDTADVRIHNVAPTPDAGSDRTVFRNEVVDLSGSWTDPATSLDDPYTFAWTVAGQHAAGTALYGDALAHTATFPTQGVYTVSLAVTDEDGGTASDDAVVTVLNRPPDCTGVLPSQSSLWPPDHRMVPVSLSGATDAEGDRLTYVVTSIFQDEPVTTIADDHAAPDGAGAGTATASVRAERAGGGLVAGNGRVYHLRFTVHDGHGGSCRGTVLVGVPHHLGGTAVDDGPLYDSTVV